MTERFLDQLIDLSEQRWRMASQEISSLQAKLQSNDLIDDFECNLALDSLLHYCSDQLQSKSFPVTMKVVRVLPFLQSIYELCSDYQMLASKKAELNDKMAKIDRQRKTFGWLDSTVGCCGGACFAIPLSIAQGWGCGGISSLVLLVTIILLIFDYEFREHFFDAGQWSTGDWIMILVVVYAIVFILSNLLPILLMQNFGSESHESYSELSKKYDFLLDRLDEVKSRYFVNTEKILGTKFIKIIPTDDDSFLEKIGKSEEPMSAAEMGKFMEIAGTVERYSNSGWKVWEDERKQQGKVRRIYWEEKLGLHFISNFLDEIEGERKQTRKQTLGEMREERLNLSVDMINEANRNRESNERNGN